MTIGDEGVVMLDARPVRTPARRPLALPGAALAEAVAEEWRAVAEEIDPRAMPLTGIANAAIDIVAPDRARFATGLAAYGASDLLCYRADEPEPLVTRQRDAWDPILAWARQRYDVRIETTTGVMPVAQPPATLHRLDAAIAAYDPFHLAAASPIVTLTGSLILTLALLDGGADAAMIWRAAQIDEDWQTEMWGEDYLAKETREARRADYDGAVRFLTLL